MPDTSIVSVRIESDDFPTEHLQIRELVGTEHLSRLFSFDVDLVHATKSREGLPASVASASVVLVFERDGSEVRRIHGMVAAFAERLDNQLDARLYRMKIVPRAFRLSLVETSEVFLDRTIPEIISEKLERFGLGREASEMRLSATYPTREYVLQYKESDLAFVSRLAEHAGIAFHIESGDTGDKVVWSDHPGGFARVKERLRVGNVGAKAQAWDFHCESRVIPAAYVVNDYDFANPRLDLTTTRDVDAGYGGGIVEHAPNYTSPEDGAYLARIRAEGLECRRVVYRGRSNQCLLGAGSVVPLEESLAEHEAILVESVTHRIVQAVTELGGMRDATTYSNEFTALRAAVPFRPERSTRRPFVSGLLVGFVVDHLAEGPYGAVDDIGCYTVHLHLDTAPHPNRHSLPIRMIQAHAGASYGAHMPLRPGTEVMVAFLAGDPDRPVIVGAVPNAITPSPVVAANAQINKILRTETGIVIEARDLYPPESNATQQGPGS